MKCPECSTSNSPERAYCKYCGYVFPHSGSGPLLNVGFSSRSNFASFTRRAAAAIVDLAIVSLALSGLGLIFVSPDSPGGAFHEINRFVTFTLRFSFIFDFTFHFGVLNLIYHILMECSPWQATLGKAAFGITVVDATGNRITWMRSANRNLGKIASFMLAGLGFFVPIFHPKRQALHDMLANCFVVH